MACCERAKRRLEVRQRRRSLEKESVPVQAWANGWDATSPPSRSLIFSAWMASPSVGNWARPGQAGLSSSCFMLNRIEPEKPKKNFWTVSC